MRVDNSRNFDKESGTIGNNNSINGRNVQYRETNKMMKNSTSVDYKGEESDSVIVELSKDGLEKLKESKLRDSSAEWRKELESQHIQNQKEWEESGAVVQNVARRIIPNIQLNDKLVNSLSGLGENIIDAAYSIINDNLLTHDGAISEEERMELISLGLEKAKYLAEHYMEKEKADEFMSAMNTIAKIGTSGTVNENGILQYDVPRGPLVGAPDDYVNEFDIMKKADRSAWNKYSSMMNEAIQTNEKEKMLSAMKYALDWSKKMHRTNSNIFEEEIKNYSDWKKHIGDTELPDFYERVNRTSKENFSVSVYELGGNLTREILEKNLNLFFRHL